MIHRILSVLRPTRTTLWTLLVLVCAATAAAIGGVGALAIDRAASVERPASAGMVVYLADTATDELATRVVGELRAMPGVEHVELVTSEQTAARLAHELGEALHADLSARGLPVSIEVAVAPGVHDVIALSPAVAALRTTPGVEDIAFAEAEVAGASLAPVRAVGWFAAALVGGLALLIILATIRVRLERGRQERAVVDLLGAGPGFLAVPTAFAGAAHTIFAALIAGALVHAGLATWGEELAAVAGFAIEAPAPAELALFVGALGVLGLVGGALAGFAGTPARRELAHG